MEGLDGVCAGRVSINGTSKLGQVNKLEPEMKFAESLMTESQVASSQTECCKFAHVWQMIEASLCRLGKIQVIHAGLQVASARVDIQARCLLS